jgi:hypothetical protein
MKRSRSPCDKCGEPASIACSLCANSLCVKCGLKCGICAETVCVDSCDTCDVCDKIICHNCSVEHNVCKCCNRTFTHADAGILCIDCTALHWLASKPSRGFNCQACVDTCCDSECKVNSILKDQTTCPICFDDFDDDDYELQVCNLHKVCKSCNYMRVKGCPICRVGK